jgi:hypothetical protein
MGNMYGAGPGFAYGNMGQPQWGKISYDVAYPLITPLNNTCAQTTHAQTTPLEYPSLYTT